MPRPSASHAPRTPLVFLVVGFLFSLAANLLWCAPGGPVRILGGAFASIALPGAMHLWRLVPVDAGPWYWRRIARDLVMFAISALAIAVTFRHASSLLMAHGEDEWLAYAYPVTTELVVIFAVMAWRPGVRVSGRAAQKERTARVTPRSAPSSPDDLTAARSRRAAFDLDVMVAWLSGRPVGKPTDELNQLIEEFGCGRTFAQRVRKAAGRVMVS